MSGYGSLDGSGPAQNKFVIIGLMAATGVVLLFTIIGTALPQGEISVPFGQQGGPTEMVPVTTNAWKTCSGDVCSNEFGLKFCSGEVCVEVFSCDEVTHRMYAVRAFTVLTCAALFGAIVTLGIQLAAKRLPKLIPAMVLGVAWFSGAVSWAIIAGTYRTKLCFASFLTTGSYGPGFGLSVAAWVFLTVEVGVAVFFALKR